MFQFDLPQEKFKTEQKIEVRHGKNVPVMSLATVVEVQGYRIKLRVDEKKDFWRHPHSDDIFPVGYSVQNGCTLRLSSGDGLILLFFY